MYGVSGVYYFLDARCLILARLARCLASSALRAACVAWEVVGRAPVVDGLLWVESPLVDVLLASAFLALRRVASIVSF